MRQLRVKTTSCPQTKLLASHCQYDYSLHNEERGSYAPGWANETTSGYNAVVNRAFHFQSGDQLDTYLYTGDHSRYEAGGYVYEFRGRLSDLRSNHLATAPARLDRQSDASGDHPSDAVQPKRRLVHIGCSPGRVPLVDHHRSLCSFRTDQLSR